MAKRARVTCPYELVREHGLWTIRKTSSQRTLYSIHLESMGQGDNGYFIFKTRVEAEEAASEHGLHVSGSCVTGRFVDPGNVNVFFIGSTPVIQQYAEDEDEAEDEDT